MKKLFTLILSAFAAVGIQAQNADFPLQFADAEGNIIADGTVLQLTKVEDDGFNLLMPSGLYMKNVSSASVHGSGVYSIRQLDNGVFQTCFPQNCVAQEHTGENFKTDEADFAAGELRFMNTEWLPDGAGSAIVEYQLVKYKKNSITNKWNLDGYGSTVTLKFSYDPASISDAVSTSPLRSVTYYTLDGRRVATPADGIFLVKQQYQSGKSIITKQLFQ